MLTSRQFRRHEVNSLCYFLVFPETQTGHKAKRMHLQTRSHFHRDFDQLPNSSEEIQTSNGLEARCLFVSTFH